MSSVKVAVRVRPFNEREKGTACCVVMVSFQPILTISSLLLTMCRMEQRRNLSIPERPMNARSLSITPFGRMMASKKMAMASSFPLPLSTLIRTSSSRPSAVKSLTTPGTATIVAFLHTVRQVLANLIRW